MIAVAVAVAAVILETSADDSGRVAATSAANHSVAIASPSSGAGESVGRKGEGSTESGSEDRASSSAGSRLSDAGDPSDAAKLAADERGTRANRGEDKGIRSIPNAERVKRHEALSCTALGKPINFQIFSAGPSVGGLSLNDVNRTCGGDVSVNEPPANFINYLYGDCELATGATGCMLPLQIQSFPACQRSLADYSLEGQPLPYRELPKIGEAEVVEIDLMGESRIEVYTGETTIVIFATTAALANEALTQLAHQEEGMPPARTAGELNPHPDKSLAAPSDGAIEGDLPCRS